MSPKSKIPHRSRFSPTKSLKFLSQIPRPIFVESPTNPFLVSCISRRRSVPCASISSLPQNPATTPASCVASSTLRPSSVAFRGVPLGFASFSSASNRFGAPRLSAKGKKSIAPASVDKSAIAPPAEAKSKKRKDFSSRRAKLQELDSSPPNVDLSFADVEASTSSQLDKSFPSAESLSYARTAVHNFLELGLHQLGESQRLAMISAVSILKASPEFSAEHHLLDSIATIFSDSDATQTKLTSLMAKRDDFHNKRRRAEAMEQENLSVRDQIRNLTVEYDVCEDVVKKFEREIAEQQSKMAFVPPEPNGATRIGVNKNF
ncbi:hypothetical protein F511_43284 [Dorcoceras hygrometricum]|uniref:Uncharacterized protein n=1 Tax=Dorcoceras hygrometricum TaxID=472368 RepID=A0A2Z6ZYZ0_9LAMI|nr:hypothetical protein F511_43284 [Dorcoceras hygrometricum]